MVAPTYFIIDISFLLACTVSFIVFVIINIEISTNKTRITIDAVFIPFAIFIRVFIVFDLISTLSTISFFFYCFLLVRFF